MNCTRLSRAARIPCRPVPTRLLFEKGIDKILKKVGEENAEVIIAAKNPDKSELVYEASDLIYHLLVLLVERGVELPEILANCAPALDLLLSMGGIFSCKMGLILTGIRAASRCAALPSVHFNLQIILDDVVTFPGSFAQTAEDKTIQGIIAVLFFFIQVKPQLRLASSRSTRPLTRIEPSS
jgi:phosphoribosyl-ATP pyrophosphohydrolase